jgi:hypothetical protein
VKTYYAYVLFTETTRSSPAHWLRRWEDRIRSVNPPLKSSTENKRDYRPLKFVFVEMTSSVTGQFAMSLCDAAEC